MNVRQILLVTSTKVVETPTIRGLERMKIIMILVALLIPIVGIAAEHLTQGDSSHAAIDVALTLAIIIAAGFGVSSWASLHKSD